MNIFSKFKHSIPYMPELLPLAGSVMACCLMRQLEYWFERHPCGFYKFMVPNESPLYKDGDSWCEELGFTKDEFRSAFDRLGVRYKGTSALEEHAADPFQGKFYYSVLDRKTHATYYYRNHALVDAMLEQLLAEIAAKPSSGNNTPRNHGPILPAASHHSDFSGGLAASSKIDQAHVAKSAKPIVLTETTQQRLQKQKPQQPTSKSGGYDGCLPPEVRSGGCVVAESAIDSLIFPSRLQQAEHQALRRLILKCPASIRQEVLDEVEGAICKNRIRVGVVPFTRHLVKVAQAGEFTMSLGVDVQCSRQAAERQQIRVAMMASPSGFPATPKPDDELLASVPTALRASLTGLRAKVQQRQGLPIP